jgi:hypothetical protein
MYDQNYADAVRRKPMPTGEQGNCTHCKFRNLNTGSEYEWPCLILKDWICETHCTEVQMLNYADTRKMIAEQIGWGKSPDLLIRETCRVCPYRNKS